SVPPQFRGGAGRVVHRQNRTLGRQGQSEECPQSRHQGSRRRACRGPLIPGAPMSPQRNRQYLAFIRSLPCAVCGTRRQIEAAHTGPGGLAESSDFSAIPLCLKDHRTGPCSYHRLGTRKFAEVHDLDITALVAQLNSIGLRGLIQRFRQEGAEPVFHPLPLLLWLLHRVVSPSARRESCSPSPHTTS